MDLVGNFSQRQQVVAPEVFGGLPSIPVLEDATELHAEAGVAIFGFVSPNCGLDSAEPDLMCWFFFHFFICVCGFVCGGIIFIQLGMSSLAGMNKMSALRFLGTLPGFLLKLGKSGILPLSFDFSIHGVDQLAGISNVNE